MVHIYVLKLEKNKYYIGKSDVLRERLKSHFYSNGSEWTKLYRPIRVIETIKDVDDSVENSITKEYMCRYGLENVRGGAYCSVVLPKYQIKAIEMELATEDNVCFYCRKKGHFAKQCPSKKYYNNYETEKKYNDDICSRCGHSGHRSSQCYAKTFVDSKKKLTRSPSYDNSSCYRCGRNTHWSRDCFAQYHLDGSYIK